MVRVNHNQLPHEDLTRLLHQFDSTLAKLDKHKATLFLNELLGKEERLTIAKRLAAIVLISEGCSEYKTSCLLKLSPSTTGIIASKIESGAYTTMLGLLRKNKRDYLAFLDTIDSILHMGGLLPHRVGLERYRCLDNYSS